LKANLTADLVKRLKLESKPCGFDLKGKIAYEPNPEGKDYILFDADQNSPPGFGVRVAGKKTYVIQRRVSGTKRVVKSTIGNCADLTLDEARDLAATYAKTIKATGLNPNETARKIAASEITVGGAMTAYKHHLTTRVTKRAKETTIRNFERAERRFRLAKWWDKRVRDISTNEVVSLFMERQESAPTSNEQNFTWCALAIRHAIDHEMLDAATTNRAPTLAASPLKILKLKGMYRDAAEVEEQRRKNRTINPLGPSTTMGPFLEAAWARRGVNLNDTGVDFIITELAVGARRGELGKAVWGELLSAGQREEGTASHVWLDDDGPYGAYMFFAAEDTKNRRAHRMPLGPFIANLLRMRRDEAAEKTLDEGFGRRGREWVFPARNKKASLKGGHYKDAGVLMDAIGGEIGLAAVNPHDLRRSYGAVMAALNVPGSVQSRLLNHTTATPRTSDEIAAAVTARYARPEWAMLREWQERIQEHIFATAPNLYNAIRPSDRPALQAPPPHVPTPPKPRSGRPRKEAAAAEDTIGV
jgi:integrase